MIMSCQYLFSLGSFCKKTGLAFNKKSNCHADAVDATFKISKLTKNIGKSTSSDHANKKGVARQITLKNFKTTGDGDGEKNSNFNQLSYFCRWDKPCTT